MKDLLVTLLLWPLPWTAVALVSLRLMPKASIGVHLLLTTLAVAVTAWAFGAPTSESLLTAVLLWPALGALVVVFMPRQWADAIRSVSVVWLWTGFVMSIWLLGPVVKTGLEGEGPLAEYAWRALDGFFGDLATGWSYAQPGYHLVHDVPWIETFGIHYKIGVDGISLWMVILTTLLSPIALHVSWNSVETKVKEYAFSFLMLQVGMLGAFVSLDLFLFYVFWELMLVPMYLIIGVWGGKDRVYAAVKFFIYTMVGSLLMLVAIVYVVVEYRAVAMANGIPADLAITFDLERLSYLSLPWNVQTVLFFAFGLAFAIKVPMFPFHTWLPDAHVQAPTGGSVILAAVLLKLGSYGFLRFALPLFPYPSQTYAPTLAGLAVVGIVYGAYCAWVQKDVKKLVAYSSVSHLGFVMLGIFSLTPSGVEGAILQMVSHGISTGALFILVGVIYDRRHTRALADFGGLAKPMPAYATLFVIVAMSSVGLPGTNGFIGEFMILSSTFSAQPLGTWGPIQSIIAATGVILAAIYMLHAVLKMFWGPVDNQANVNLTDLTGREKWALAPLIGLIFWIGLVPGFFLHPMEASVNAFTRSVAGRMNTGPNDESRILPGGLPEVPAAEEPEEQAAEPPPEGGTAERVEPSAVRVAQAGGGQ